MCEADSATAAGLAQGSAGVGATQGSGSRAATRPRDTPVLSPSPSPCHAVAAPPAAAEGPMTGVCSTTTAGTSRDDPGTALSIARCPPSRPRAPGPPAAPTAPAPPGHGHRSLPQRSQLFSAVLQQIKPLIMVSPPAAVGWSGNQCATPHCLLSGSGDRCHKNDGQPAPSLPAVEQPVPTGSHHAAATCDAVFIWPAAAVGEGIPLGDYFYLVTSIYLY